MAKYITPAKYTGNWKNSNHGRVLKCPTCGHEFTAFIPVRAAWCPRGHVMNVLTNSNPRAARNIRPSKGVSRDAISSKKRLYGATNTRQGVRQGVRL